ncbi:hypothetical protein E4U34_001320 [Claviceps purpurea]|nr:hypothetical protein E4U12_004753 [Claviceps purpurea]KAG6136201.1 hypothetical protein E4U28_005108 [Claviceps purpurea]KAG6167932.1 hypothetical protein E4U11_006342 [Claviceps purpurea]KAG6222647.1 hypothetical protein E4U34_001320 [Claviceps purpurea]KAG6285190.1 hypothetical protein E4U46_006114 [Claviceps purpurea]
MTQAFSSRFQISCRNEASMIIQLSLRQMSLDDFVWQPQNGSWSVVERDIVVSRIGTSGEFLQLFAKRLQSWDYFFIGAIRAQASSQKANRLFNVGPSTSSYTLFEPRLLVSDEVKFRAMRPVQTPEQLELASAPRGIR